MGDVIDKDLGWKATIDAINKLASNEVVSGVQSGTSEKNGADLATIASYHEFGTSIHPQRSFIRSMFDENESVISEMAEAFGKAVVMRNTTPLEALNQMGHVVARHIQKKIDDGPFVPNAPATIKRKGSSHPLIDTGTLRSNIRHKVRPKGSE